MEDVGASGRTLHPDPGFHQAHAGRAPGAGRSRRQAQQRARSASSGSTPSAATTTPAWAWSCCWWARPSCIPRCGSGGHLSRQLSRPIEELIGWTGHIRRMEPLPPDRPRRGAPEFEALRTALREMADALEQAPRARDRGRAAPRLPRDGAAGRARDAESADADPAGRRAARARGRARRSSDAIEVLVAESGRLEQLAREFTEFGRLPEGPAAPVDLAELLDGARAHQRPAHDAACGSRSTPRLPPCWATTTRSAARSATSCATRWRRATPAGPDRARRPAPRTAACGSRSATTAPACRPSWRTACSIPTSPAKSGGTGLGLALAKQTVEMHQGAIALEATPGGGATFVVRMRRPVTARAQILLVDDEANIRRMLAALLREEGFTVAEARQRQRGPAPARRRRSRRGPARPADAARTRRARDPDPACASAGRATPVIMMSGKAQLTDAVRAVKLGAFQFLEKPLSPGVGAGDGAGRAGAQPHPGGEPRAPGRAGPPRRPWWARARPCSRCAR